MKKIRVLVWNENQHEKTEPLVTELYPGGIHEYVASFIKDADIEVKAVSLDDPEQGLDQETLDNTDVLMWWGHMAHGDVKDEYVERVVRRVYDYGMGFIPMHSGHHSKPFKRIIGCTGNLSWSDNQREIIWNMMPSHPIAQGIPDHFELADEEMYGEPFAIPQPDELVFSGWFEHGNIFRSGCVFKRGLGKIFYFQPGHETCPNLQNEYVQRILKNAVRYVAPQDMSATKYYPANQCPYIDPIIK